MRVVSLDPAATEWVFVMGAGALLVGRSHACDTPPAVQRLPPLTQPGTRGYVPDVERLRSVRPDLVLTLGAVPEADLSSMLAVWTGPPPAVFAAAPSSFKQVLDAALRLGRVLGFGTGVMRYVAGGERRLRSLRDRLPRVGSLPTVACIAEMMPLKTAAGRVSDVVELAGGRAVAAASWEALCVANPEVLALMPYGATVAETRERLPLLTQQPGWSSLRAVRGGRVFLFDGKACFHRPGPRLYRSTELLAAALYPGLVGAVTPPEVPREMVRLEPAFSG